MLKAGIVGGTGYTGAELIRLLHMHPDVKVKVMTSRGDEGLQVDELFPSLRGGTDLTFVSPDSTELNHCDIVFFATPNGVAMKSAEKLLDAGVRVIDLSADFRLKDIPTWEKWYGMSHIAPHLLSEAVYGLPEVNREKIQQARLIANPGCYPTAVQLGFLPLVEIGAVTGHVIADAKSGVSGAGRNASLAFNFCEVGDSFKSYATSGHRHLPEIQQGLNTFSPHALQLTFVPHLLPLIRGIHATLYLQVPDRTIDIQKVFESRYVNEPFVDVMPAGSHPDTRSVRGANVCRVSWHRPQDGDTVVVLAVEDNLVKGAAGQAVQNMNIMFGFNEELGLSNIGMVP